ncbi:DUF1194 domain-containing protein, partial [Rhizobium johnstonii]|uniref:DUF1194 domain-containing protein n=1 Tax=Rhizobium johnstonii TaxID=3019933 RepID=UPI003F99ACAB
VSSPFQSRRQVIDVSCDGPNNSCDPVTPARDKAVEAGMIINGLAIMLAPWAIAVEIDVRRCVAIGRASSLSAKAIASSSV